MKPITIDQNLVAVCGIYCGACKRYRKDKCPGCRENKKASWCKTRGCALEHKYLSCADCTEFEDYMVCKKFNNFFSKLFGLIFQSNRPACIQYIKDNGYEAFAKEMAEKKIVAIKR